MAKVPTFAKAFAGRWRIVEMDVWDNIVLDLLEPAHLTLKARRIAKSPSVGSKAFSTFAMAPATAPHAPSSPGRATTTAIQSSAADGS